MRGVRGKDISLIFQDPMTAFNPSLKIGEQVREPLEIHGGVSKKDGRNKVLKLFRDLDMRYPEVFYESYPYQLSGGLRQRAGIAMALINNPKLIIADEPTSSLDVTVQAQIVDLFKKLKRELHLTMILITHDLGVAANICDRIAIMYAGRIIEIGKILNIFDKQYHPYTQGLIAAVPRPENKFLTPIPWDITKVSSQGCAFRPRCSYATSLCLEQDPPLREIESEHLSACHYAETFGKK